jgi:hypothetical protein
MAFPGTRVSGTQKKEVNYASNAPQVIDVQGTNPLVKALGSNLPVEETKTENGMKTYKSSLNAATDFFFMAAALRKGGRVNQVVDMWKKVWKEDNLLAIKLLFWLRDIRGGAGEKMAFKLVLENIYKNDRLVFNKIVPYVPEYGSFKDLVEYIPRSSTVEALFIDYLKQGNGLAAKWLGRPAGKHLAQATIMAKAMNLSLKQYRHKLVELTNVVEQQMCANKWEDITYQHVPSQAMHVYRTAFFKHDGERFQQLIDSANKGEVVMKAGAIFPGDLVQKLQLRDVRNYAMHGSYYYQAQVSQQEQSAINAQWLGLPNYMEGVSASILVAADISGSMTSSNGNGSTPLSNAIALGIYVAEHQEGPFRNTMMTFSNESKFYQFTEGSSLSEKVTQINENNMGTNLFSVFERLLEVAQANKIKTEDMPKQLVIITDGEFNQYHDKSALEMAVKVYKKAGYPLPHLVFWNMASRHENVPARANQEGISLISGYSPAIMKSVLQARPLSTPTELMLETINGERYDRITI